jgi:hypothetical protein
VAQRLFVDPPSRHAIRDRMPDESTPARLLAGRDRLGRVEKDAVFEAVLAGTAAKPGRAWWWFALPAVAAAAIALVVLWPRTKPDEFTARGGDAPVAMFAPTCAQGCARGAKLVFDLQGTTGYRYFGAFARSSDGNVVWYWVGKDLLTSLERGVLDETVVLEASGTYRLYGVFSQQPLDRDGIKALFDDAGRVRDVAGVTVVEKALAVR